MEDALGDMDFKIAGTRTGITALQLDTKLPGLPLAWLSEAVSMARQAHAKLLDLMEAEVLRSDGEIQAAGGSLPQHKVRIRCGSIGSVQQGALRLTSHAQPFSHIAILVYMIRILDPPSPPARTQVLQIGEDVVEALIGEDGRGIAALQLRSRAAVSVKPDGEVQIYAPDAASMTAATLGVRAAEGTDLEAGVVYKARVLELLDFGAVVEMAVSGARHLLPISEVSHAKMRDIHDLLREEQVRVGGTGESPADGTAHIREYSGISELHLDNDPSPICSSYDRCWSYSARGWTARAWCVSA